MMRFRTVIDRIGHPSRSAFSGALIALSLGMGLSGCQEDPGWPPPNQELYWGSLADPNEPGGSMTRVYKEMQADSTVYQARLGPDLIINDHSDSLRVTFPYSEISGFHRTALADTTTLADVEAIYTDALPKVGLTRDSTFDRAVETPIIRYADYRPNPRETRQPYIRTNLLVWRYVDRWGDDDLTFVVILNIVYSGYPGRSYRFLSVGEPVRTRS